MSKITISKTSDYLEMDGKPLFYLADTLWTAFSNYSLEEWEEYLETRQSQNFNAFQANLLTQWDGGEPDTGLYPFAIDSTGKFDFGRLNREYFERARAMVETASQKGFTPVLVVLWCNYVKDTWASNNNPANIMPLEVVKSYTEYIVKLFSPYDPIYLVSGDTNFGSEQATLTYLAALDVIKTLSPQALTTLHLGGGLAELPDEILRSENYDFYMYQSSHNLESQDLAYKLAEAFYAKPVKRPILNGEPCYEGHAFGGKYGRYNEFYVRKAIWQSLLSGAKAGVTYGAHGVWGCYRDGKPFANESYGGKPLPWRTGLRLKGAWEASFARWVFDTFQLFDLEPKKLVLNDTPEIRMSVSGDTCKVVLYVPYNADVRVNMDLSGYDWTLINMSDKLFARPVVKMENGCSIIKMHDFNSDVLVIGMR